MSENALVVVERADHVARLVNVVEEATLRRDVLRRNNHDVLVAEMRKARAFPHSSLGIIRLGNGDDRFVVPVEEIAGLEQNDLGAGAVVDSVADNAVIFAVVVPDFGIAEVDIGDNRVVVRNVDDGIFFVLGEVDTVFGIGVALTLGDVAAARTAGRIDTGRIGRGGIDAARTVEALAGVHEPEFAFKFDAAAAEAAVPVVPFVTFGQRARRNCDRLVFPTAEIFARGMPPMHWTPVDGIRVVLVENVILPFVPAEAVRIVQPSAGRSNVILRIPFRRLCNFRRRKICHFDTSQFFKVAIIVKPYRKKIKCNFSDYLFFIWEFSGIFQAKVERRR